MEQNCPTAIDRENIFEKLFIVVVYCISVFESHICLNSLIYLSFKPAPCNYKLDQKHQNLEKKRILCWQFKL